MRIASFAARAELRPGLYLLVALVALVELLVAPGALAGEEMDVRKGGSLWARIEKGGAIRIDGVIVGEIEDDGTIRVEGHIAGRVEEDGEIREDGTVRTRVEKDGTLRRNGTVIGRIEESGAIRRHGTIWGEASPCCASFDDLRRLTALLLFFDRTFFVR
ncbi:MAG: polymer-forming cytoskeletal protein [Thermoanaerobaculia bacterium]|nr:polymer-forming cytoskeletal protein [Thermoanaerobaculia bacterium]